MIKEKSLQFASHNSSHGKREKGDARREYKKGVSKKKDRANMPKVRKSGK